MIYISVWVCDDAENAAKEFSVEGTPDDRGDNPI